MISNGTNWFEALKAKFPSMQLRKATKSASSASKDPREAVFALIENSMALLKDSKHTVSKRGNTYTPESCVRTVGGQHEVSLSYCRAKLVLPDGNEAMVVDPAVTATLLEALKAEVAAGNFDDQLARIKTDRVAKLGGAAKPAKPNKKAA